MLPELTIRRGRGIPVRRQIELHIESRILSGSLPGGTRLPSLRRMAGRLDVHRNTVAAAYRELARAGLVTVRHGSGMYACRSPRQHRDRPTLVSRQPPLVIARESELAVLLAAEILLLTGLEIEAATPVQLHAGDTGPAGRHLIVTPDCMADVLELPANLSPSRVTEVPIDPVHHLHDFVCRLRAPAVIAVVTSSDKVSDLVSGGIWRLRGDAVAVRRFVKPHEACAARTLAIADLILADPSLVSNVPKPPQGSRRARAPILLIAFREGGFTGFGNLLPCVR